LEVPDRVRYGNRHEPLFAAETERASIDGCRRADVGGNVADGERRIEDDRAARPSEGQNEEVRSQWRRRVSSRLQLLRMRREGAGEEGDDAQAEDRGAAHGGANSRTMKAITVEPKVAGSARLDDVPEPDPRDGAIVVEAIAVGVCG